MLVHCRKFAFVFHFESFAVYKKTNFAPYLHRNLQNISGIIPSSPGVAGEGKPTKFKFKSKQALWSSLFRCIIGYKRVTTCARVCRSRKHSSVASAGHWTTTTTAFVDWAWARVNSSSVEGTSGWWSCRGNFCYLYPPKSVRTCVLLKILWSFAILCHIIPFQIKPR